MSGLSKGEKWLARAMVPGFVGVAALCYLAWRPCEPVAQAKVLDKPFVPPAVEVAPPTLTIPTITIVAKAPSQGSRKGVAGVSAKSAPVCTDQSPEWHCWDYQLTAGSGDVIKECDCDPSHGR